MRLLKTQFFVCVLALPALVLAATLSQILQTMDESAAAFRSMSAKVRRVAHTAVINEDSVDAGTMYLKRPRPHDLRMLVDLTEPDPKSVAYQGRKVEIFFPKIQTVQEYDLGKSKDLVEQYLLLGFGSSGKELSAAYDIRALGEETVAGQKATRLELIPKSKQVLEHLNKVELWISDSGGYPVQQKLYMPGGDYTLITYTDIKVNPDLPDGALRLKLPKNVKREFPQK